MDDVVAVEDLAGESFWSAAKACWADLRSPDLSAWARDWKSVLFCCALDCQSTGETPLEEEIADTDMGFGGLSLTMDG